MVQYIVPQFVPHFRKTKSKGFPLEKQSTVHQRNFGQSTDRKFTKILVRSAKIMGEITKITEGIATKGNYDLVLDKSAQALRSNQVFVYTKPGMDITPTVMKELNKDAPEGFDPSKKKAPAVPAAPAAPAN